jgi:hypothetical protein
MPSYKIIVFSCDCRLIMQSSSNSDVSSTANLTLETPTTTSSTSETPTPPSTNSSTTATGGASTPLSKKDILVNMARLLKKKNQKKFMDDIHRTAEMKAADNIPEQYDNFFEEINTAYNEFMFHWLEEAKSQPCKILNKALFLNQFLIMIKVTNAIVEKAITASERLTAVFSSVEKLIEVDRKIDPIPLKTKQQQPVTVQQVFGIVYEVISFSSGKPMWDNTLKFSELIPSFSNTDDLKLLQTINQSPHRNFFNKLPFKYSQFIQYWLQRAEDPSLQLSKRSLFFEYYQVTINLMNITMKKTIDSLTHTVSADTAPAVAVSSTCSASSPD